MSCAVGGGSAAAGPPAFLPPCSRQSLRSLRSLRLVAAAGGGGRAIVWGNR
ncbi:hypothetical protein J3R04_003051 [Spirilliplanes yamanashiensis]|nr:hypothetical protein [Spirilliplanes yamanashiensis]